MREEVLEGAISRLEDSVQDLGGGLSLKVGQYTACSVATE